MGDQSKKETVRVVKTEEVRVVDPIDKYSALIVRVRTTSLPSP